jgi:hypothetical protein
MRQEGSDMWDMGFISEDDFKSHVTNTIAACEDNLGSFDTAKFNGNQAG